MMNSNTKIFFILQFIRITEKWDMYYTFLRVSNIIILSLHSNT